MLLLLKHLLIALLVLDSTQGTGETFGERDALFFIVYGVVDNLTHSKLVLKVRCTLALQVGSVHVAHHYAKVAVLEGRVVVLFFVHFFVYNIRFSHLEAAAGTTLVDF